MPGILDILDYVVSQGVVALPCNLSYLGGKEMGWRVQYQCGLLSEILVLQQQQHKRETEDTALDAEAGRSQFRGQLEPHQETIGVVVHAGNSSTWEGNKGRGLSQGRLQQPSKFQAGLVL